MTGADNWDYTVADNRIKKLYELGKELNWNGSIDLNWDYTHPADERILETDDELPHETLEAYENLSDEEKILFDRHDVAELMSQYLPNFFFLIRNQIFRYNPFESFRIPLSKQSCTIFITSKLIFKVARNLMLAISYAKSSLKLLKKKHLCGIVYT